MELVQCYVAAQIGGELVENGYMHMYGCPFCCSLETITTLLITYVYVLVVSNSVIPWRRECHSTPVFLPGDFHGQRSLVGYSP